MEVRCALCGKTVKELVEEELQDRYNVEGIDISLNDELSFPYKLCNYCEELLRVVVPKILEAEGVIKFDEKADKYTLTIK